MKDLKEYIINLKLNSEQLKAIGINPLKNGNIPSIHNIITGNKVSLDKIMKLETKKIISNELY